MIMIKFNVDRILGSVFTTGSTVRGFSISTKQLNIIQKELKIVISFDQEFTKKGKEIQF